MSREQPKRDRPRLQHLARCFALGRDLWAELHSEARRTGWPMGKLVILRLARVASAPQGATMSRTSDDVEAELAIRHLPWVEGEPRSWLALVRDAARSAGALLADVCSTEVHRPAAVRARQQAWRELRTVGYSYPEIAAPWGADHTSVRTAVLKRVPPLRLRIT